MKVKGQSSDTMASHCAQSYGPYIVVHGGSRLPFGTTTRQSLFAFDTRSRKWNHLDQSIADDDCPIGLYGHSMSIIDDVLYLVGGTTGLMYYSNVYAFDLKGPPKWQQLFTVSFLHYRIIALALYDEKNRFFSAHSLAEIIALLSVID